MVHILNVATVDTLQIYLPFKRTTDLKTTLSRTRFIRRIFCYMLSSDYYIVTSFFFIELNRILISLSKDARYNLSHQLCFFTCSRVTHAQRTRADQQHKLVTISRAVFAQSASPWINEVVHLQRLAVNFFAASLYIMLIP